MAVMMAKATLSWQSRKQVASARSACEAESTSLLGVVVEILSIWQFLKDISVVNNFWLETVEKLGI